MTEPTNEERIARAKELADQIVQVLRGLPDSAYTDENGDLVRKFDDSETREDVARRCARYILRQLDVYDAGGCPLCLS